MRYLLAIAMLCVMSVDVVGEDKNTDPLSGLSPEAIKNLNEFAKELNAKKERNEKIQKAMAAYRNQATPDNAKAFADLAKDLPLADQALQLELMKAAKFNPYALEPELLGGTPVVVLPQPKPFQRPGDGSGQGFVNVQPDPDVERLKQQVAQLSYMVEELKGVLRKVKADNADLAKQVAAEKARAETLEKALEQLTKP